MMKAFQCQMCGTCCHGKGGIRLKKEEIKDISRFLGMTEGSFITECCVERRGRFSIKTGPDRFCMFYDKEKHCLIHSVKPHACSSWPFYPAIVRDADNWEMVKEACPGINPECSFEDFVRQSRE